MRLARATLIWAALAAAICVPIAARGGEPAARMARSGLHPGRIRRDHRAGSHARSASADRRILAGTVGLSRAACPSLDRRRAGRGGGGPRRRPLDHQSAGHDRRPSLRIADAVLPLRCDRHVGDLRRRASGCTAPAIGTAPRTWRIAHMSLAVVIVVGSVVHAMLVEGTMETMSKAALCALVLGAAIKVMADLRVWRKRATSRGESLARR